MSGGCFLFLNVFMNITPNILRNHTPIFIVINPVKITVFDQFLNIVIQRILIDKFYYFFRILGFVYCYLIFHDLFCFVI